MAVRCHLLFDHLVDAQQQRPLLSAVAAPACRRLVLTGSTLRPHPVEFKGAIARSLREKIWPLIEAVIIKPAIHKFFALAQASEARKLMGSSAHIGKIVLTV